MYSAVTYTAYQHHGWRKLSLHCGVCGTCRAYSHWAASARAASALLRTTERLACSPRNAACTFAMARIFIQCAGSCRVNSRVPTASHEESGTFRFEQNSSIVDQNFASSLITAGAPCMRRSWKVGCVWGGVSTAMQLRRLARRRSSSWPIRRQKNSPLR